MLRLLVHRVTRVMSAIALVTITAIGVGCCGTPPATPRTTAGGDGDRGPAPAPDVRVAPGAVETTAGAATLSQVPFNLGVGKPFQIDGFPGLQSYAFAYSIMPDQSVKWLLLGGRTNGLHGFHPDPNEPDTVNTLKQNFPIAAANTSAWVLDLKARRVWSASLAPIPARFSEALSATNTQCVQEGDTLYVAGGYGFSASATTPGQMTTFDTLTSIPVQAMISAVMAGNLAPVVPQLQQVQAPCLKITGGGLEKIDDTFYLVFGQLFDGMYSITAADTGSMFVQSYSEVVSTFSVVASPLAIQNVQIYPSTNRFAPSRPFHRRDLTVSRTVDLSGKPRIAAYGGVFVPGTFAGYVNPVYIEPYSASTAPMAPDSFEQLLSQYDCASLSVFDARTPAVYTVFFGGISQYHYGAHPPALVRDAVDLAQGLDGIPFIDTISGMQLAASGTRGFVLPQPMPPPPGSLLGAKGYFGAEARLLMNPGTPMVTDSVVNLAGLQGPMTVGFICGGIEAFGPYTAQASRNSVASPYFFEVTLAPTAMDVIPMPNAPAAPPVKSPAPVGRER